MNPNRQAGGRRAQKEGKSFELHLIDMAHLEGFAVLHIKPAARWIRNPGQPMARPIPEKSTIDYVFGKDGQAIFLDAKSCDQNTFGKSLIKKHQIDKLVEFRDRGFACGYLVYFRKINRVCFFNATTVEAVKENESLNPVLAEYIAPLEEFRFSNLVSLIQK